MKNDSVLTKILNKIKEQKTDNEICEELNITPKTLWYYTLLLQNQGYSFIRHYYYDGEIQRILKTQRFELPDRPLKSEIIIPKDKNTVKFLVCSDIHIGNIGYNPEIVDRVCNYCVKNGINNILFTGDLLDGTYTKDVKCRALSEVEEQITTLLKKFPYDKSLIWTGILGDHDLSVFSNYGINLVEIIKNRRQDFQMKGYINTALGLKNDNVLLSHDCSQISKVLQDEYYPLIINGHSHFYKGSTNESQVIINVPSLSTITDVPPTAIVLECYFERGLIKSCARKHLLFLDRDVVIAEEDYDLSHTIKSGTREVKELQKVKTQQPTGPSQVDKFNSRWGRNS